MLFICSSVNGHMGCFCLWALVNDAAMSIPIRVSVWTYVFISLGYGKVVCKAISTPSLKSEPVS